MDPLAIRMWFESIDTDRSGHLNASELQRALALAGLQFGVSEAHSFIRAFDWQGNNTLNVDEFAQLYAFLSKVQDTFSLFDRDRSGRLSPPELQAAVEQAGFRLDATAMSTLLARHDPSATGHLGRAEYVRLCMFLQGATKAFSAFDTARKGQVELTFNQLVYSASHLP